MEYKLQSLFAGGKSAILAGIAVGLGGKASVTGRGTGVTSLIQEGKKYAMVLNFVFLKICLICFFFHLVVRRK